ncbi:MAG TPA: ketoacyl-ACP synthase III family protein [Micromonosporaceae bacterium]|nr:ketoacyl-ACP synthase III family protein [Micromonosporaceae bacterium]
MRVRDTYISGIGVFLPERESIESAVQKGLLTEEKARSQGYGSATVAGELSAPEMALRAAQDALKQSGVGPDQVDLLLYANVWHQGPDGWGPQYYLQHYLLGDDVLAVEIRHGCNGMFSGIELGIGYLRAEEQRSAALIVGSDNFGTPMMNRWAPGGGFSVMGDGASAVLLTKEPGFAQLLSVCTATFSEMEEAHRAGEPLFPPGATTGRVLDFMVRAEAYKEKVVAEGTGSQILVRHQRCNIECTNRALADAEIEMGDVKRAITHNISREEAKAYLGVLGFPLERSTWGFGSGVGHLGASDHAVSLHHLVATGQVGPGDHVLLCGFSPGVTYKSAIVKILEMPAWAGAPA